MKVLGKINNVLSFAETSFIILILSIMVLLAFLQVILRNVFLSGIIWGDTFLRHLVLWLGFLGAALASERGKHISIDLVGRFVKGKTSIVIQLITNLFAMAISYLLARAGWTFLQSEIDSGDILFSIGEKSLPTWWFEIIIPSGFGLISFHFLIRVIEQIILLIRPHPSTKSE